MTRKADFNAEEWEVVVAGPLYAGLRVISADRGGTLRESLAMSRFYAEARAEHGASDLLDDLLGSPPAVDAGQLREAGSDPSSVARQQLRRAVSILVEKATASELDAYKRFVMTLAQTVAGAHKEGGFLGVGEKQISAAENEALDEISTALGAPPAA